MTTYFPEEILEQILGHITSQRDRNAASLVCKSWYKVDRNTRHAVFIGNCYALSPDRLIRRFPEVKSVTLKGKPRFADGNSIPGDWGGSVHPWAVALAENCPNLQELRLKRMVVSDQTLLLISKSFPNFKSLALIRCHGFSTDGLAAIAANCRFLEHLDLQKSEAVGDYRGHWLSCFPESCTSLVSLNFSCLKGEVDPVDLKKLVARCPNLRSLRLNGAVHQPNLPKILMQAPQLMELEIASDFTFGNGESYTRLCEAFRKCKSIKNLSLSSVLHLSLSYLYAISPLCLNLISLDMSSAPVVRNSGFVALIKQCRKLQRLWVSDSIGDEGLAVVASSCKGLRDLRVFQSYPRVQVNHAVTEEGLVCISMGCPLLRSLQFFCQQMTNAALITVAKNCPSLACFRLCIVDPKKPDHATLQPLDEGFGAIVQSCKGLRRLSLSGLLTDQVFLYIGMYAEQLETLLAPFAGDSDGGILCVLNGCRNLRKLEVRACSFGDATLLADVGKYELMRFLWISSCEITLGGCKVLAKKMPSLNVEVINEQHKVEDYPDDRFKVQNLYLYRTLDGPRKDAPAFVWTL